MGAKENRVKGQDYERWLSKLYIDYGIDKCATRMPMSGADQYMKGDIRHGHPVCIPFKFIDEAKRQENISWYEWWNQTKRQCGQSEEPVLHFKKSHEDSLTVIKTETFFSLLGTIIELDSQKNIDTKQLEGKNGYVKTQAMNKLKYIKQEVANLLQLIDKKYDDTE